MQADGQPSSGTGRSGTRPTCAACVGQRQAIADLRDTSLTRAWGRDTEGVPALPTTRQWYGTRLSEWPSPPFRDVGRGATLRNIPRAEIDEVMQPAATATPLLLVMSRQRSRRPVLLGVARPCGVPELG